MYYIKFLLCQNKMTRSDYYYWLSIMKYEFMINSFTVVDFKKPPFKDISISNDLRTIPNN